MDQREVQPNAEVAEKMVLPLYHFNGFVPCGWRIFRFLTSAVISFSLNNFRSFRSGSALRAMAQAR